MSRNIFKRNAEVLRIISSAMCDINDSSFIGSFDRSDQAIPFKPGQIPKSYFEFEDSMKPIKFDGSSGTAEDEWMLRQISHRGFLIAKGCQATSVLANQPLNKQKNCFELGKYFHLTWQAFVEKEAFKVEPPMEDFKLNLVSAPVLFHLSHEPSLYDTIVKESNSDDGIDYASLYNKVYNGPGTEKTENLMRKLKDKTQRQLQQFSSSDEKFKIENILHDFE